MGSLNTDGSRIGQVRRSVRNLGGAQNISIDRLESELQRDDVDLGTIPSEALSQLTLINGGHAIKITNSLEDLLDSRNIVAGLTGDIAPAQTLPGGTSILSTIVNILNGGSATLSASDNRVQIVTGAGLRTVFLPTSPTTNAIFDIKDGSGTAASGNIVINGNGKLIDGSASGALTTNYESLTMIYNSVQWNFI